MTLSPKDAGVSGSQGFKRWSHGELRMARRMSVGIRGKFRGGSSSTSPGTYSELLGGRKSAPLTPREKWTEEEEVLSGGTSRSDWNGSSYFRSMEERVNHAIGTLKEIQREIDKRAAEDEELARKLMGEIELYSGKYHARFSTINSALHDYYASLSTIEMRLDGLLATSPSLGAKRSSSRLWWGILDLFSSIFLLLVKVFVVIPYHFAIGLPRRFRW